MNNFSGIVQNAEKAEIESIGLNVSNEQVNFSSDKKSNIDKYLEYVENLNSATLRWERVLCVDSQNEAALLNCANNEFMLGNAEKSMQYLDRLPESLQLNNFRKLYELRAKIFSNNGNNLLAIESWKMANEYGYDEDQCNLRIASQYYKLGDIDNARLYVNKAGSDEGVVEYADIIRARCFAYEKKWSLAIDLLQGYEEYKTHKESAAEILYRCYLNEFRSENAASVCEVFRESNQSKYYQYQGKIKMQQHLFNEAIEYFNASFDLSQNVESKIWMIKTLTATHEHESAESQARLAVLSDSKDDLIAAKIWEAAGVLSEAETRYKRAAEKNGGYESHSAYIKFLFNNRNWGEAYKALYVAERNGIKSESLVQIKKTITDALASTGRKLSLSRFSFFKSEFYSSEEMVSAIVDRILARNKYTNDLNSDKNIALVIGSLGAGGAERQVVNLANGLAAADDIENVSLLCTHLSRTDQDCFYLDQLEDRIHVEEYYRRSEEINPASIPELEDFSDLLCHIQPASRLQVILHLARELIDIKPTVVHGWLDETFINTALVCHMLGIKNVVGRWGSMPPGVNRTVTEKINSNIRYLQFAYKQVARLPYLKYTSNSRLTGDAYADLLNVDRDEVEIIYNGVNIDHLNVENHGDMRELRELWSIPDDKIIIGTVIRISEEKRPFLFVDVAVELIKRRQDVHFVLVGGGPLENQLSDYIISKGVENSISMVGKQSDVGQWYDLFSILLLTSRVEGVSNVVVESQMCGLPVVAPNVGGLSEAMIDGETGYLLDDHSVFSFVDALTSLIEDKEKIEKLGDNAKIFTQERFSLTRMVSFYRNVAAR